MHIILLIVLLTGGDFFHKFSCSFLLFVSHIVFCRNGVTRKFYPQQTTRNALLHYFLLILVSLSMKIMYIILSVQDNKELAQKYYIFVQKIEFFWCIEKNYWCIKKQTQNSELSFIGSKLNTQTQVSTLPQSRAKHRLQKERNSNSKLCTDQN